MPCVIVVLKREIAADCHRQQNSAGKRARPFELIGATVDRAWAAVSVMSFHSQRTTLRTSKSRRAQLADH